MFRISQIFSSLSACGLRKRWHGFEAVIICFFLLACSLYGSLHAESCLLPACFSPPSCMGSHCTDSVHLLQQIRNEKQISVSKHTCFKPSGHFWAPLIVFSQSWLGGITQWLCQQLQFKSCFLFILSYKFWLCSVCWIWCRPRAGKQKQSISQSTVWLL